MGGAVAVIRLTNDLLRDYIVRVLGAPEPAAGRTHLIGLRSARVLDRTSITRIHPLPNQYDDVLILFGKQLAAFPCTVDPGLRYNWRPINPRGTAHLCNGGPYPYVRGLHRRKPALVQDGPVRIWRDENRNGVRDNGEKCHPENGIGINIHRGGSSAIVDAWSAGCQVIPLGEWPEFWECVKASGQTRFEYYLGNASELL